MPTDKYSQEKYSEQYIELLQIAQENSIALGLPTPEAWINEKVEDSLIETLQSFMLEAFYPHMYSILPIYWGNSCQFLSAHIYSHLKSVGINCEIIVGEVEINGTPECDATLENLRQEYLSKQPQQGGQLIHAWVSIGGDTIIDAGLPDRIIKNYRFPERFMPPIMVGRASELSAKFRARHQPLLIGAEYIGKTNQLDLQGMQEKYSATLTS